MANNNFSPAVVTSRRAADDYAKIKLQHNDLLNGMAVQSQKITAFNQQKQSELAAQNSMKAELEKEKMTADSAAKKDALTFQMKQSELDVKRAALSLAGK